MNDSTKRYSFLIRFCLFLLVFGSMAYFYNGSNWNSSARMCQVYRIVEDGVLNIDTFTGETGDFSISKDKHFYPNKPPGASFLGVIPYFIIYNIEKLIGVNPDDHLKTVLFNDYFVKLISNDLIFSIACIFFFNLILRLSGNILFSVIPVISLSLGTLLWPYSSVYMGHVQAASFFIIGFYYYGKIYFDFESSKLDFVVLGLCMGISFIIDFFCIYIVLPVLVHAFVLAFKKEKMNLSFLLFSFLVPLIILMAYQWNVFGSPFDTPMKYNNPIFKYDRADLFLGAFIFPRFIVLKELLTGQFHGLFTFNPILIAGIPGLMLLLSEKKTYILGIVILTGVIISIFSNVCFIGWWGGHTCGSRYLIPVIPILIFPIYKLLKYKSIKLVFLIIIPLSVFINLAIVSTSPYGKFKSLKYEIFEDFKAYKYASSKSFPRIEDSIVPENLKKISAFNMGQIAGLDDKKSLLPLFMYNLFLFFLIFYMSKQLEFFET